MAGKSVSRGRGAPEKQARILRARSIARISTTFSATPYVTICSRHHFWCGPARC